MAHRNEYEVEPSGESVVQTAAGVTEQAEELVGSIGQTMDSTAQTIQNTLRRTKKSASAAMGRVADGIDTTTEYLAERGMAGVAEDVETLIRRHPLQALMLGILVGYLLSRSRQR
jgi:ElaB/YqjD/DUF883 family membrane-anchored ribosome-binding protein